jgi:spoIIIJ-associated protein
MNDAKRRFFSGDSLQQALVQAANYFNLDPAYVAYKSLEKRHGFLKTRRKVVIEVDPDNPRRESPAPLPPAERVVPPPPPSSYLTRDPSLPSPEPQMMAEMPPPVPSERPPRRERERPERAERRGRDRGGDRGRSEGDRDRPRRGRGDDAPRRPRRSPLDVEEARQPPVPVVEGEAGLVTLPEKPRGISERYPPAAGAVAEAASKSANLLIRIAGLDLEARVFQGEERLEVELLGDDVDWCFADDGEFLNAVEHLLPRMIRTLSGEAAVVRVDCDNFHEIREERLRSLAQRIAEDVRRKGRPRILEPMNPADRRIIHTTLADDPGVVTESEGEGYFKRVMVRPA